MACISGQRVYNASFDNMAYFRQFALAPEEEWKVATVWPASFSPDPGPDDVVSFHTSCSMEFGITSASLIAQRGADANNFIFRQIMSYMLEKYWHLVPEPLQELLKRRAALNAPGLPRQDVCWDILEYTDDPSLDVAGADMFAITVHVYLTVIDGVKQIPPHRRPKAATRGDVSRALSAGPNTTRSRHQS